MLCVIETLPYLVVDHYRGLMPHVSSITAHVDVFSETDTMRRGFATVEYRTIILRKNKSIYLRITETYDNNFINQKLTVSEKEYGGGY